MTSFLSDNMTKEEEEHIKRMVVFAKRQHAENLKKRQRGPLTPEELADAIIQLKKKYPDHFPAKDPDC